MRIISGRFRHRKLNANPGMTTRPITDRAKVMLFDNVQRYLEDQRVADLFSGTGSLGLEALSRGARSVVFMEQDRRAFELLKNNVAALGVEDETFCWRADALRSSFKPKGLAGFYPYDFVFFDPPYSMLAELQTDSAEAAPGRPEPRGLSIAKSLERLSRDDVTSERAFLVLRGPRETDLVLPEPWQPERTWRSAGMHMHLFRKGTPPATQ